jgi:hypothetical protein
MSYDRLQELAKNHEADSKNGKTPVTDAIFSSKKITIAIDAIMTTVDQDANGNKDVKGYIKSENGTSTSGVSAAANGTVETRGKVYHCSNTDDYNWLVSMFGSASIDTYKNTGEVKNNKLTVEYYTDVKTYGASATGSWSVNQSTGQICYNGKPYTKEYYLWEDMQPADLKTVLTGVGYAPTGAWQCEKSGCLLMEGKRYHISYLAQYAALASKNGSIYSANGTLKLYARWRENGYTIEYYTKTDKSSDKYTRIAKEDCAIGKTYRYSYASNTQAPAVNGVELLYWTEGTASGAAIRRCGESFSDSDYPETRKTSGLVIKLYAVWGVKAYTITCEETLPSEDVYDFYEIYGVGFTTKKSFAETGSAYDPFYWSKSKYLVQASGLLLEPPTSEEYAWNGFWDKKKEKQYFLPNGRAVFSSSKTFTKDTTIYGSWKKVYTLTVMYQLGNGVTVSGNDAGYGVDENGYLTVNGTIYAKEVPSTGSVKILKIPDCVSKNGCTKESKWKIEGTSESIAGNKSYAAATLAKKAGDDLTKRNVTVVLAVSWNTIRYYVDYYFRNDLTGTYERKATQSCEFGNTYRFYTEKQMEGLQVPNGMKFAGWSRKEGAQTASFKGEESFSNLCSKADERVALYGVWEGMTYAIALNGNCPSDSENPVVMGTSRICYVYGKGFYSKGDSGNVQNSCSIRIPSCQGYEFKGYYSMQSGGVLMVDSAGNSTAALSYSEYERTLYAQWEQKTYRISYHANGGTFAAGAWGNSQVVTLGGIAYGSYLPVTVSPYRDGYSFNGYSQNADQTGELWYNRFLNAGSRRYNLAQDVDLYAAWVDDIVPTGIIRASAGNSSDAWTNRNVNLTITANDLGSGITKIQLFQKRYCESSYRMVREWNTSPAKSYTGSVTISTNGISSFYCIVWDAAGNTNRRIFGMDSDLISTTTTVIYVDKVAPKITAPELSDARVGDDSASVSLYASDDVIE